MTPLETLPAAAPDRITPDGTARDRAPTEHEPPPAAGPRWAMRGGLLLALVGAVGLALGVEPFRTYFYAFVWWGWIAAASGWTQARAGRSLLFTRPRAFGLLTLWSVTFWLLFEVLNIALDNWYYVGSMPTLAGRLLGMTVCFATVLPGVFVTRDCIAALGFAAGARLRARPIGAGASRNLALCGVLFTALPLIWPTYFYPLVWGATFFLGEAFLVHRGQRGLIVCLAAGDPRPALQLLAAGFVTGGLWESWNFFAGAKWMYTVPFFEHLKLFEMPLLGFLGFPPFALECYSFACILVALGLCPPFDEGFDAEDAARTTTTRATLGALAAAVLAVPMMFATDAEVVRGTRALVSEMKSLPSGSQTALTRAGYTDVRDLLAVIHGDHAPTAWSSLPPQLRAAAESEMELMNTALMGARGVAWLDAISVENAHELAALDWRRVVSLAGSATPVAQSLLRRYGPAPYDREVRNWVRAARRATEH
ncbi:hypothetical protein [Engelhardtia mirabilis]|uniref:DUF4332 domain-containing protein n=1 Tax=Engelhardtia mirabilis TaxID=2528011 RepID=A0A518BHZ0_9BACT|nr:hypothetical protein Pla133_16740 [Planctomycetes bacterium Pla133]QDV00924.1 hypothetical protein Pla86_16730 [Planctomycetes bacterium Pla86]